jgi:AcrR family transcriptional regulator
MRLIDLVSKRSLVDAQRHNKGVNMAPKKRMKGSVRKQAIISAARPLFAQNGFHGTSVRDIAKAADVSEALLYRHFPGKEALYDEVLDYVGMLSSATFERLQEIEASTEALVVYFYFMVRLILFEVPGLGDQQRWHERLLFRSLLGDNRYAQAHFQNMQKAVEKSISMCCDEAIRAGDLVEIPVGNRNKMWFVHHLAMALNLCHMSEEPAFQYQGSKEKLAEQAVHFCLRGIGMTEAAIARYFQPRKLRAMFKRIYEQEASSD